MAISYKTTAMKEIEIKNETLSTKVAEVIRNMIIKGECPMGSRIAETDFSEAMGVSRACIREAFYTLESEGLLIKKANKPTYVNSFEAKDVRDIYNLRVVIEVMCLEESVKNNTIDIPRLKKTSDNIIKNYSKRKEKGDLSWVKDDMMFHEFLVGSAGNTYASRVFSSLKNQIMTVLYAAHKVVPDLIVPLGDSGNHEAIVNNIINGEIEKAAETLKKHILTVSENICKSI